MEELMLYVRYQAKPGCREKFVRQLVEECLTEREADIIRQRYGLGGRKPRTQRELAADYGISRSYV